jgi:hypothetical protein
MLIKVTAALEDSITTQKPIFVVIGLRLAWYHISRRLRNRLIHPPECGTLCPASSTGWIHLAHLGPIAFRLGDRMGSMACFRYRMSVSRVFVLRSSTRGGD